MNTVLWYFFHFFMGVFWLALKLWKVVSKWGWQSGLEVPIQSHFRGTHKMISFQWRPFIIRHVRRCPISGRGGQLTGLERRNGLADVTDWYLPPTNEVCEGYVFTRVCHSVHRGGSTWAGTPQTRYTPRDQVHPPGSGTPPWDQIHPLGPGTPPGPGTLPWDQVHPLGPGTPNRIWYTQWDQVQPPPTRYTPGSSACWEIRATSGRYASYWNAFWFSNLLTYKYIVRPVGLCSINREWIPRTGLTELPVHEIRVIHLVLC